MSIPECFKLDEDIEEAIADFHKELKAKHMKAVSVLLNEGTKDGTPGVLVTAGMSQGEVVYVLWECMMGVVNNMKKTLTDELSGVLTEIVKKVAEGPEEV